MDFGEKVELIKEKFYEMKSLTGYYHYYVQAYQWQNWDYVFCTLRNGRLVTVYLKGDTVYPVF